MRRSDIAIWMMFLAVLILWFIFFMAGSPT